MLLKDTHLYTKKNIINMSEALSSSYYIKKEEYFSWNHHKDIMKKERKNYDENKLF